MFDADSGYNHGEFDTVSVCDSLGFELVIVKSLWKYESQVSTILFDLASDTFTPSLFGNTPRK